MSLLVLGLMIVIIGAVCIGENIKINHERNKMYKNGIPDHIVTKYETYK